MSKLLHESVYRKLRWAREYIHEHHAEPLRLEEMARQAAMSPFHFQRMFRQAFSETPHEWLTRTRLQRARELLAGPGVSVTEVCLSVGFSSLGSFSSLFRKYHGAPPREFLRRYVQVIQTPRGLALRHIPACFWMRFGPGGQ